MPIQRVEEALDDFRTGKMIILVDDEDRENEGDLVIAAEKVTPEAVNFMAKCGRGLICLALTGERCDKLNLAPMVAENTSSFQTAFTVSIEARTGVTTGISAADRATTIRAAIADDAKLEDRAQYFPYDPATAASWCAPAKRRAPSIWRVSPASNPPPSSVRP